MGEEGGLTRMADRCASDSEMRPSARDSMSMKVGTSEKKAASTRGGTKPCRKDVNLGLCSTNGCRNSRPLHGTDKAEREALEQARGGGQCVGCWCIGMLMCGCVDMGEVRYRVLERDLRLASDATRPTGMV